VAAALQDHHRAVIMGTQSFGKGSVQTVLPLEGDQTAIKLTTALYYAPSGRTIQAKGVTPDVVVEELTIPETVKAADNFFISEAELDNRLMAEDDHPADAASPTAPPAPVVIPVAVPANAKKDSNASKSPEINSEDLALMDEVQGEAKDLDTSREILYKDYQLHEAINLLKGLNIIQTNVSKNAKPTQTK
jgi:carboxyl-terminal processing protease